MNLLDNIRHSLKYIRIKNLNNSTFKMPFYAVARGFTTGIYTSWPQCEEQVKGFQKPKYRKFPTREAADQFLQENSASSHSSLTNISSSTSTNILPDSSSIFSNDRASSSKEIPASTKKGLNVDKLPEELREIHKDFKRQQKDLSILRDKFDAYVRQNHPQAFEEKSEKVSRKRSLSPNNERNQSEIKRRILDKPLEFLPNSFKLDSDGFVIVYTDGCCEGNGRASAKAGVGVYFGEGSNLNVAEPVVGRATNNTGEIQAITHALEIIKRAGHDKALVHTDSQFTINCMTQWLDGWKRKGWKKSDGSEVINKSDLIDLESASRGITVKYVHVKGHSGILGNEIADGLAREGALKFKRDF